MMASKLILFICFYLLFLDNSLGKKSVLEKHKNKKLLADAFDYGDDYGGDLRVLGLKWKNLLQEIVFAQRKVGFHEDQLERFNDAARELGRAQKDVDFYKLLYRKAPVSQFKQKLDAVKEIYAGKFAALIAIRTQDIAKDQKRINDLEAEKDEIAIAMIDKMEEINEEFKRKNVRRKVKEAKEDGITDSDIKEILFADFFESGGLSLIGEGASIAGSLLSSFRKGMESLIDGDYDSTLGVIEFVNGRGGDIPLEDFGGGGDGGAPEGDGGSPGDAAGGGGSPGGTAGGGSGGGSGGPPTSPPSGPPSGAEVPDDSHEQEGGEDEDTEEAKLRKCLATTLRMDDEETNTQEPIQMEDLSRIDADYIVNQTMRSIRREVQRLDREMQPLFTQYENGFGNLPVALLDPNRELSEAESLGLANGRINYYQGILETAVAIRDRSDELRNRLREKNKITKLNQEYFHALSSTDAGVFVPPKPPPIVEFENIPVNDRDNFRVQALVAGITWREMQAISSLSDRTHINLCRITNFLERLIGYEEDKISIINAHRSSRE